MFRKLIIVILLSVLCSIGFAVSLEYAYDTATSGEGFDKYIVLEAGTVYTGGLHIGQTFDNETDTFVGDYGASTKIIGNGALLDLQHEQITIAYTDINFEISDCVIINGNIRFVGRTDSTNDIFPSGLVEYVTFYNNDDYGIRTLACGDEITIRRNIFYNAIYTGNDFLQYNGEVNEFLPTGVNFAISFQGTLRPMSQIYENWSYFSRSTVNQDSLYHFAMYCDYG